MKRILTVVVLLLTTSVHSSVAGSQNILQRQNIQKGSLLVERKTRENSHYLPDKIIIKLKSSLSISNSQSLFNIAQLDAALSKYSVNSITRVFENRISPAEKNRVDLSKFYVVEFSAPFNPFTVAEELSQNSEVEYAEPWFIYPVEACRPNDPNRGSQWHLNKVLSDSAWCSETGDTSIVIGIVDTGIELSHSDLSGNIWHNPGESGGGKETNGVDDDGNGKIDDWRGWDFGGADYNNPIEDNNPVPTASNNGHGTHVGGIASATTNNGVGISGMAYNCRLLAIKTTSDNDTRGGGGTPYVVFGFQGIVYAADMGAHVINCSWGGGGYSQFEQDVIRSVTEQGSVVVAAAGNAGNETPNYPASYDGVVSVASTTTSDGKSSFSQYGAYIDVCAPGSNIYSTLFSNTYGNMSGTSMASPLAAGLIALTKSHFPSYSMLQAAEQVRISCDNIDGINSLYRNKLGRGRINALNALTIVSPSVRFSNLVISDSAYGNNNGIPERDDTLEVYMTFTNYLTPTTSAAASFTTTDTTYIKLLDTSFTIGVLHTMGSISNQSDPFRVVVKNTMPFNRSLNFKLTIRDGSFTDVFLIPVFVNPTYNHHTVNNARVTLTNKGGIGFNDFPNNRQGIGFIYGGANQLFEGGLLIGYSPTKIVNVVRNPNGTQDTDFGSNETYIMRQGTIADEEGSTMFTDSAAPVTPRIGLRIKMYSYAYAASPNDNYVILRYDIQNISGADISNLFAGLFFDWDILDYTKNKSDYDTARHLGYAWDVSAPTAVYCGTSVLESPSGFRGLVNNANIVLTDAAKFDWLSGGIVKDTTTNDIHYAISSGPYSIPNGSTVMVAFALLGGITLADLQTSADAALAKWLEIKALVNVEEQKQEVPTTFRLNQNYPNPFNPTTEIRYQTSEVGNVSLKIYDVLGREVASLVNESKPAGIYTVQWNASSVPSGVYFYRVVAGAFVETKKMILMK
jgi:subtilisin family serine protease